MRRMAPKLFAATQTPGAAQAVMRSAAAARTAKPAEAAPVQARSLLSSARSPAEPETPQPRHPRGVADFARALFEQKQVPEPQQSPVGLTNAGGLARMQATPLRVPRMPDRRVAAPERGMTPHELLVAIQRGRLTADDPVHGARVRAVLRGVDNSSLARRHN